MRINKGFYLGALFLIGLIFIIMGLWDYDEAQQANSTYLVLGAVFLLLSIFGRNVRKR